MCWLATGDMRLCCRTQRQASAEWCAWWVLGKAGTELQDEGLGSGAEYVLSSALGCANDLVER